MIPTGHTRRLPGMVSAAILGFVVLACCSCSQPTSQTPAVLATGTPLPSAEERWHALLQITPYPWGTPLPPSAQTVLDGTYVKFDPGTEPRWNCRRCPDYKPEGGTWLLNLDKGVFRIQFVDTGWSSFGSMIVAGDRMMLFNDPNCIDAVGEYRWKVEDGALVLSLIADECAIRLRGKNLTKQPWLACEGHDQPTGCP